MADVIDEYGNPIQLTDERGYPVQLTDEHGNPMHLTGVAISPTNVSTAGSTLPPGGGGAGAGGGVGDTNVMSGPGYGVVSGKGMHGYAGETITDQPVHERGSSSSSSSEDDGQGGRTRKKKGLTQKIKEKFTGGKASDEHDREHQQTFGPTVGTATTVTTHSEPHEKKGMMEKIKEKLPGGHHNH